MLINLSPSPCSVHTIGMRRLAKLSLLPIRFLIKSPHRVSVSIPHRCYFHSKMSDPLQEDRELGEFFDFMENLKNFERIGVPSGAATDTDDGFDLGRMRRLLHRLGNPQTKFKAVHIAGTKGKGSTAAFLSNILREEGYSVGCYTSPHLLTVRERISTGRNGSPVSAEVLKNLFHDVKGILDKSIELENGALSHFEVFTALAYALFYQEKVDIAVIEAGLGGARDATNILSSTELALSIITTIGEEHLAALGGSLESIAMAKSGIIKNGRPVVIGGPFEPHIECIIRGKASSTSSVVVSACEGGVQSTMKCFGREEGVPYQSCDINIRTTEGLGLSLDLSDVRLYMLGKHQLQNAVTATCAALCLRNQGWKISDKSIRGGLEHTRLLGRSQFLTDREIGALGLSQSTVIVDGAHTESSAKYLADVLKMTFPDRQVALVVAMASDKDHLAFAKQLLSVGRPEVVVLTEVTIAGGTSRTASASTLKDAWTTAAQELGIHMLELDYEHTDGAYSNFSSESFDNRPLTFICCKSTPIADLLEVAEQLLKSRARDRPRVIAVTGSLHIASSLLAALGQYPMG